MAIGKLYFAAFFDRSKVVVSQVDYRRAVIKERSAFKVQIQAAIVHVYCSDDAELIVGNIAFCVYKAGRILIYFHACSDKRCIVRSRQTVDHLFIGYSRGNKAHVNTALCREAQRVLQAAVNGEIRRCYINIAACTVEDIGIDIFARILIVERTVGKAEDIAVVFAAALFILFGHIVM